jgi:dephospho-CoA kinase
MQRDGISAVEVQKVLAAQMDRNSRLAAADDVIDNSAGLEQIRIRVAELDQEYRRLASSTP